ncbi:MAG: hypothetical protein PHT62_06040 [Desulfotomaculaceae bacterium]|nr:hypothetical protein [Desulfotomaculaceae bacterium]
MTGGLTDEFDQVLQSIIGIELLTFFQANPHTRDTVDGLALRLHRPQHQVEMALNTLCAIGILEIGGTKKVNIYHLSNRDLVSGYCQEQCDKYRIVPHFR